MRAIAILGVVFYHLNATYCPAGYFGVDVFLVISGYFLLASLMKAERAGDIHYGSYLLKKSWRIVPSWLVVSCVFCFGCALFMISQDRYEVCNTAARSAYFVADYYIDHLYDYFNQTAHQNLFLHYWYLSITCQMYLLVPLLVMLFLRFFSKRVTVMLLGGVGVLSLVFYVLTTSMQVPVGIRQTLLEAVGMKTAYYHLLPRLWEILIGGAVLLLPAWAERPRLRKSLELLGVICILTSFFCYDTGSPQVYLAVAGALLFLRFGGEGIVSRLLSWRPIQWVGTISFSLYLWHWPIMAAWKYVSLEGVTWYDELGMVLLSFLLAALAWRFIETLKMPRATSRATLAAQFIPFVLMLAFAFGIRPYYKGIKAAAFDGLTGKGLMAEIVAQINTLPRDEALLKGFAIDILKGQPAYIGTDTTVAPSFLVMGDSHSYHSFFGLHHACAKRGLRGVSLNIPVSPLWYCYKEGVGHWNEAEAEAVLEYLRQHPSIKYVFIVLMWEARVYGDASLNGGETMDWREMRSLSFEEQIALREEGLGETCRRLKAMGVKPVLLADIPILPKNLVPYQLNQKVQMLRGHDAPEYLTPVEVHRANAARYTRLMKRLYDGGDAWAVIDCAEALRQGEHYRTRNDEGLFLYSDNNHLTYAGSDIVGEYVVEEWLRQAGEQGMTPPDTPEVPAVGGASSSSEVGTTHSVSQGN